MSIISEEKIRNELVRRVAEQMLAAARTAPKGKGTDNLVLLMLDKRGIKKVSEKLLEMVKREEAPPFFGRDGENILKAEWMILLGTKIKAMEVFPCGMCGYADCDEKNRHPEHPCVFNAGDLGIAIGSAVSMAMDNRIDNRVMYTVGQAAMRMGILDNEVKIAYGIPLSVSGKNPFFDRK
jgi:uncharacterized ferredoxin-like protein